MKILKYLHAIVTLLLGVLCVALLSERRGARIGLQNDQGGLQAVKKETIEASKNTTGEVHTALSMQDALVHSQVAEAQPNPRLNALATNMRNDPAFSEVRRRQAAQIVFRKYGDLSTLKLSDSTIQQLRQLLADKLRIPVDIPQIAMSQGVKINSKEMRQALQDAIDANNNEIMALIGPEGEAKLGQMEKETAAMNAVQNMVGSDLALAGIPLNPDQLHELANLYRSSFTTSGKTPIDELASGYSPRAQEMITKATPFLSAAQMEIFSQDVLLADQAKGLQARAVANTFRAPPPPPK